MAEWTGWQKIMLDRYPFLLYHLANALDQLHSCMLLSREAEGPAL
jgi:hypothetical protein